MAAELDKLARRLIKQGYITAGERILNLIPDWKKIGLIPDTLSKKPIVPKAVVAEQEEDINSAELNRVRSELLETHYGQYVGIVGGKVVDFDTNDRILSRRLHESYPNQGGLIEHLVKDEEKRVYNVGPNLRLLLKTKSHKIT